MPQVFGCPNCENPFQVPENAAGQTFACPSCNTTIEIPATLKSTARPKQPRYDKDVEVFECPFCSGQFGVDPAVSAESLTCPHCDEKVAIDETAEPSESDPDIKLQELSKQLHDSKIQKTVKKRLSKEPGGTTVVSEEFQPKPVDHLLPPRFDVPDPVRFPTRIGSDNVILPDGDGGYRSVEANIVTMVHDGQVYRLKKMTPVQRQRRKLIHSVVTILFAIVLIYLTLHTIGLIS